MANVPAENERQLLLLIAQANMPAFHELYRVYAGALQSYIYLFTRSNEDTEEILQDVFIKLWEKKDALPEIENIRSYLFRMARNMVLNYLQRVKPKLRSVALDEEHAVQAVEDVADKLLFKEHYQMALRAIEQLPERRKEVFNLATREDLTFQEIAERLNISVSAVKQHYYQALSSLRRYLQQNKAITSATLIFLTLFQK